MGSSSMLSLLALRFSDESSSSDRWAPLEKTPDCRRESVGSWLTLGGLGLLSVDGGVGLGRGREEILIGSIPSAGLSSKRLLVGNCF